MNASPEPVLARVQTQAYGPRTPVLAASFLLAGLGTVVLGPLLPTLLREWALTDARGGLLLLAKFIGAFAGGAFVSRHLPKSLALGHLLAFVGFALFAFAHGLGLATPALLLSGFGLGQIIASTNILAGQRWHSHTGSALALLNFFWSLGAVSTGVLVAALTPRTGWRGPTLALALLFLLVGFAGSLLPSRTPVSPIFATAQSSEPASAPAPPLAAILRAGAQMLLYGGLETCLSAWLTTFALRFAHGALLGGQSAFVVFWASLTSGRVLASAMMRRWTETAVQRTSLVLCLLLTLFLAVTSSAAVLSLLCILLGFALAPVFPSMFALLLRDIPTPRGAGPMLAITGLGAAFFPWIMGVVSTGSGTLRWAMGVPALLSFGLILLAKRTIPPAMA